MKPILYISNRTADGTETATVGTRVELSPATDLWMAGSRFGRIERIEGESAWVRLDRGAFQGRKGDWVHRENLTREP